LRSRTRAGRVLRSCALTLLPSCAPVLLRSRAFTLLCSYPLMLLSALWICLRFRVEDLGFLPLSASNLLPMRLAQPALVWSRNSRRRSSSVEISLVQHSHTTKICQPRRLNALIFLRARSTFPLRFFSQNRQFVLGLTRPYLQRCICQKQP